MLFQKNKGGFIANIFRVLVGFKSWVGYSAENSAAKLPKLKKGVLNSALPHRNINLSIKQREQLDFLYARDYHVKIDLDIVLKCLRELGN